MLYAIILLLVAVALIVLEVIIPSGGLISIVACGAAVASIVLAFQSGVAVGITFIVLSLLGMPVAIGIGFKLMPKTAIGRKLILSGKVGPEAQRGFAGVDDVDFTTLQGKTGITVTQLRPSGIAEIEGQRYSVVSEGEIIEQNTQIVVMNVEGNNVIVTKIT